MGLAPDFGDRATAERQNLLVGFCVIWLVISTTAVILRLLARRIVVTQWSGLKFHWDDFFVLVALVWNHCAQILTIVSVTYGFGAHIEDLSIQRIRKQLKLDFAFEILIVLVLPFVKWSLLCLYWRLFPSRNFRIACRILSGLIFALTCFAFFSVLFQCKPVSFFWTRRGPGTCVQVQKLFETQAILDMILDITVLVLPIPVIWEIQTSVAKRYGLIVAFSLGLFVVIISIVRIWAYSELSTPDFLLHDYNSVFFSCAESGLAILVACIPSLVPLVRFTFKKLRQNEKAATIYRRLGLKDRSGLWIACEGRISIKPTHRRNADSMERDMSRAGFLGGPTEEHTIMMRPSDDLEPGRFVLARSRGWSGSWEIRPQNMAMRSEPELPPRDLVMKPLPELPQQVYDPRKLSSQF